MANPFPATGHCLCGAVKAVVKAPPVRMGQCHCTDCQKVTGTGHGTNVFFKEGDVEISGKTTSFAKPADSGNVVTRSFCTTCGTRMFYVNSARPGVVGFPIGIFDDDKSWYQPGYAIYLRNRPVWDSVPDGVPMFEVMYT